MKGYLSVPKFLTTEILKNKHEVSKVWIKYMAMSKH